VKIALQNQMATEQIAKNHNTEPKRR
jgi:hypothetical protein